MLERQKAFAKYLLNMGFNVHSSALIDRETFCNSPFHQEVESVYRSLGGILDEYPVNIGEFDIISSDFFIEFDEEHHFNRYRAKTLESPIYDEYDHFPVYDYLDYCEDFEDNVGKGGKFWTTDGSEKQFGKSSQPKDLNGHGPARWKQRAFYDFLKDVYSLIVNKPVYRFSIYEEVAYSDIHNILKSGNNEKELLEYVSNRINRNFQKKINEV